MKYRQGGTIAVGDWVKHRESNQLVKVEEIDPKCGLLVITIKRPYMYSWVGNELACSYKVLTVRPRAVKPAEPEELI